jgi:hypothetical protein
MGTRAIHISKDKPEWTIVNSIVVQEGLSSIHKLAHKVFRSESSHCCSIGGHNASGIHADLRKGKVVVRKRRVNPPQLPPGMDTRGSDVRKR